MILSISDKKIDYYTDKIDSFDICKPLLCILIVMIHVNPLPFRIDGLISPFTRIGVPVFYLISGFLFFRKYDRLDDAEEQRLMFRKYIKRLLAMYLFWLIVFLGPTIEKRWWFHKGILQGLPKFFNSLFFGSTFIASWYLMAAMLGMALVLYLGRHLSQRSCLVIAGLCYTITCIYSSHSYLSVLSGIGAMNNFWREVRINPCNSVLVGFFWLQLSRVVARNLSRWLNQFERSGALPLLGIAAALLLCLEHRFTRAFEMPAHDDCFLSLVILCPLVFFAILQLRVTSPHTALFRKWSSLTYAAHGSIGYILKQLRDYYELPMPPVVRFCLTLVVCTLILMLFERLVRHPRFAWLKNVY